MKKIVIVNLIVIVLITGSLEIASRFYDRHEINTLPPVPGNAEGFGDFSGHLRFVNHLSSVQEYICGGFGVDYEPYTVILRKPKYFFNIKNINYRMNSIGLRSREVAVPKPSNVFRIVMLGGSTVEGGFNDDWIISHYLEQELKGHYEGVEVINAGIQSYISQNELALLQTKILDLQPDLVVIFDGRNDLFFSIGDEWNNRRGPHYASFKIALDGLINYPTFQSLSSNLARFLIKKSSAANRVFRLLFWKKTERIFHKQFKIKDLAIDTYLDNLRLIKAMLEVKGIMGIIAFQPTLGYGKDHLTPYEKTIQRSLEGFDWLPQVRVVWPQVGRQVAALSTSGPVRTYDLSRLFENTVETAYIDSCHYVPLGNQIIGAKIAQIVRSDFGGFLKRFSKNTN